LQELKKIVPDPPEPTRGDSSPKCGEKLATDAYLPVLHRPVSPPVRSTRQSLGQTRQDLSASSAETIRFSSAPDSWSFLYDGSAMSGSLERCHSLAPYTTIREWIPRGVCSVHRKKDGCWRSTAGRLSPEPAHELSHAEQMAFHCLENLLTVRPGRQVELGVHGIDPEIIPVYA